MGVSINGENELRGKKSARLQKRGNGDAIDRYQSPGEAGDASEKEVMITTVGNNL